LTHRSISNKVPKTNFTNWLPTDGDTFATREGFVFNVLGYEHPTDRVFAFLKYIPAGLKSQFHIDYLENTWDYGQQKLFRAEKLYTAQNYQDFLKTFGKSYPAYAYFCPFREKEVISAPLSLIKQVFVPRECLNRLTRLDSRDSLQETALRLVTRLSTESNINIEDFGIHGSIALNMHTPKSDIDLVVYGAQNFRKLETTINMLVEADVLSFKFNNRLDAARRHKGKYKNTVYMYNAVRKLEEINSRYGELKYAPIIPVKFDCKIKDDSEAMFRPAIYKIEDYKPADVSSSLADDKIPELVTSMIGCYRNIARKGGTVRVSGVLERVENLETGHVFYQVVVGTGTSEEEHIWPLQP